MPAAVPVFITVLKSLKPAIIYKKMGVKIRARYWIGQGLGEFKVRQL
jgi:hypothetical protein